MSDGDGPGEPGFLATVIRFSGLGLEMGAAVGIGVFAGWWLDSRYETGPWGLLGGVVLGGAAAARLVWRSLAVLNRGRGERSESE